MLNDLSDTDDFEELQTWATYPPRDGNNVWFYNDACEDVRGEAGAFRDIENAINEARHFIFVCDWSFHPQVVLTRTIDPDNNWIFKLGEQLAQKAEANDDILIAIHAWKHAGDDNTSDAAGKYLGELNGDDPKPPNLLWRATHRTGILWSHHQKYIILDAPTDDEDDDIRQVKVFFGGLDLTRGRYDYPDHPIVGALANQYFKSSNYDDWYNGEFGHDENLPREPWHDIHAGLTGPAAWDFVYEFVGRWNSGRGGTAKGFGIVGDKDKEQLVWQKYLEIEDHLEIFNQDETPDDGPWTCQVYRSIENKAWTKPKKPYDKTTLADLFAWNVADRERTAKTYERSIQEAYLDAIAAAEDYIYIETQYLIGGPITEGFLTKNKDKNKIPGALVNRIIQKHQDKEPFHVYILLPMFPEGDPISFQTQPVRYWQQQTIEWMVNQINNVVGPNGNSWQEYLSFYFLGQRSGDVEYDEDAKLTRKERVADANRYMIYVHSKMMIVDDNWIIIGSANLNERSMAGDRDTEICVGMWPTEDDDEESVAQIRDFRLRLWGEHLGLDFIDDNQAAVRDEPGSLETANLIQAAAAENLRLFYEDTADPTMNHLMAWAPYSGLSGGRYNYIPDYGIDKWEKYWRWNQTGHTTGGSDIRFL